MDAEAYADMLPWLVFFVVDRRSGPSVAWAAGCAGLAAVALVAWSYWRGRAAPLPRLALVVFAALLAGALGSATWDHLVGSTRAVAAGALGVAAFVSLRFTPVSHAYTAPLVASAHRDDPAFVRVNKEISASWAVGSLAVGVSCGVSDFVHDKVAFTVFDWVVPLVLACATLLWASRRLELFRLAIDTPISVRPGMPGRGAVPTIRALVPRNSAEGASTDTDAVIRPLRHKRGL